MIDQVSEPSLGSAMHPAGGIPMVSLDPFGEAFLSDPYAHHDTLRDAGPVVWLSAYDVYAAARHAEVSQALRDHETFCSGRGVGLSDFAKETLWRTPSLLLETDPPLHDRTRAIMNKIVTPVVLKALRERWLEKAVGLVDEIVARRHVDAVADIAEILPLRVFPDTIGLPREGRENLLPFAETVFNTFGPRNRLYDDALNAGQAAIAWVAAACRRESLAPGGWGAAVYEAADAGLCSAEEAERLVRSFLSAGVDTTVTGIGNMLRAFSLYPAEWAKVRADPTLRKKAFEESLRWDSTVQTFFRTTTRQTVLGGTALPEGAKILLFLGAANRDPRRWQDPDRFDSTRQASGHVAFGFGIHQCLGQMVARLEADVLLEAMLPRIAEIKPAGPAVQRLNNTIHTLASAPMEFVPA